MEGYKKKAKMCKSADRKSDADSRRRTEIKDGFNKLNNTKRYKKRLKLNEQKKKLKKTFDDGPSTEEIKGKKKKKKQ